MTDTPSQKEAQKTPAAKRKPAKKKLTVEDVQIAAKGGDEAFNYFVATGALPGVDRTPR